VRFRNGQPPAGSPSLTPRAADAVLVVDSGGCRYAFELACVAEVRGMSSAATPAHSSMHAVLDRNGIRIRVLRLDAALDASCAGEARAVIVLDLADRLVAVAVDAVCEVRIPHTRSFVPPTDRAEALSANVAWVAVWDGGEAPVLDVAAWLRACEADPLPSAQAAS
jgi:chemotaxis signal transduction protein